METAIDLFMLILCCRIYNDWIDNITTAWLTRCDQCTISNFLTINFNLQSSRTYPDYSSNEYGIAEETTSNEIQRDLVTLSRQVRSAVDIALNFLEQNGIEGCPRGT